MSLSLIIPLVCKAGSEGEVNDRVRRGVGAVIFSNSGASGCADAHPQIKMNLAAATTDSREQPQLTGQLFPLHCYKGQRSLPNSNKCHVAKEVASGGGHLQELCSRSWLYCKLLGDTAPATFTL